jgi:hypothetical protein
MPLKFMQPVNTPRGPGFFIGYVTTTENERQCQVAIRERGIQENPLFQLDEVTDPKAKKPIEPVLQVVEAQ